MDCVFCKIVNGQSPAYKVYEDDVCLAFLDINPVNKGHCLVIPKQHYEDFLITPDEISSHIIIVAKKVARAIKKANGAEGINFGVNNGSAAGQIVFHAHLHVMPRFSGDGLKLWKSREYQDDQEKQNMADKIKKAI